MNPSGKGGSQPGRGPLVLQARLLEENGRRVPVSSPGDAASSSPGDVAACAPSAAVSAPAARDRSGSSPAPHAESRLEALDTEIAWASVPTAAYRPGATLTGAPLDRASAIVSHEVRDDPSIRATAGGDALRPAGVDGQGWGVTAEERDHRAVADEFDARSAHASDGSSRRLEVDDENFADALKALSETEADAATGDDRDPSRDWSPEPFAGRGVGVSGWIRWLVVLLMLAGIAQMAAGVVASWPESPLQSSLTAGMTLLLVLLIGSLIWQWRRTNRRLGQFDALRAELADALARHERADPVWFDRFLRLSRLREARPDVETRLRSQFHEGLSAEELVALINRDVYAPLDGRARTLIRADASATGVFIAVSPWILADLALVVWRNGRLMRRLADLYGWPPGARSRWMLLRGVMRNMALAGVSEFAIHTLSTSLLSDLMGKLTARVAQGVAVGLYSARLGAFAMTACRVTPLPDRRFLAEDSQSIVRDIRRSLGPER